MNRWEWAHGTILTEKYFLVLVLALLVFYFIIKKEIQELKWAGGLLFFAVVVFIIILVTEFLEGHKGKISAHELEYPKLNMELLANIPIIFLAYSFQAGFFPAYESLQEKTDANGLKVGFLALAFSFVGMSRSLNL